ncbi:MAG: DUF962 domain-containing protein [Alphaproteobacteria bacterium]|nr:DUF962 domain-containing protein [Alphaproteobacteria bacterium]
MTSLQEQMAMYAAYHRDLRNRATHFVGIPTIVFSLLLAFALVRLPIGGFDASLGMLVTLALMIYYYLLDRTLAVIATVIFGAMVVAAERLVTGWSATEAWTWFALLFVGGWILQLVGHVFEGRKPALVDNLFQIFVAPLFLIAETLFAVNLMTELRLAVEARIPKYLPAAAERPRAEAA